jgi:hypothetical protein
VGHKVVTTHLCIFLYVITGRKYTGRCMNDFTADSYARQPGLRRRERRPRRLGFVRSRSND